MSTRLWAVSLRWFSVMISVWGCELTSSAEQRETWSLTESPSPSYEHRAWLDSAAPQALIPLSSLERASAELIRYLNQYKRLPSSELVAHILDAYGAPVWGAELRVWTELQEGESLSARLKLIKSQHARAQAFELRRPLFYGLADERSLGGRRQLIITAPALIELAPLHRLKRRSDGQLRVDFRLPQGLSSPRGLISRSSGGIEEIMISSHAGQYTAQASCPRAQSCVIELLADGALGLKPLTQLSFPRALEELSQLPDEPRSLGPARGAHLQEKRDWLLSKLQEERARVSLPPLSLDPHLTRVAQAHAQEMASAHYFAHHSPRSGSPLQRLHSSGYVALKVGENIAQNKTLLGAHRSLYRSLGHRRNMLDPDYSKVGIGVSSGAQGELVTQLFALPAPRYSPADEPSLIAQLLKRIQRGEALELCQLEDESQRRRTERCALLSEGLLRVRAKLQALERLTQAPRELSPEELISWSGLEAQPYQLSAWVARSGALVALKLPHELKEEHSALSIGLRVKPSQHSAWPELEVWALSLSGATQGAP